MWSQDGQHFEYDWKNIGKKRSIILLLSETDSTKHFLPNNAIWSIIESIVPILEVMEVYVKLFFNVLGFYQLFCFRDRMTLSLLIPTMQKIKSIFVETNNSNSLTVVALKTCIRNGIIKSFPIDSNAKNYNAAWMKAAFLDPR